MNKLENYLDNVTEIYKDLNYKNTNELRAFILENKFLSIIYFGVDYDYIFFLGLYYPNHNQ